MSSPLHLVHPVIVGVDVVLPLRQKVLRPHLSIKETENAEDRLLSSFHIAMVKDSEPISVGSFYLCSHKDLKAERPYRLRGMATHPDYRGQGIGSDLLRFAMNEIKQRHGDLLWMHARQKAFSFYESLGFHFYGDFFEQPVSGIHKVMYKSL